MKTAVLLTHHEPADTDAALAATLKAASDASYTLVATPEEIAKHGSSAQGIEAVETLPQRPDLCLVLGGDGTILRALRHYACTGVPVFAVNYGTIGFLATVDPDELDAGLHRAFAGEFSTMTLPGLYAALPEGRRVALNDISFTRRPHGRVAELAYSLTGEEVGHVRCDGLVAATPAGSTGYNLANGGPILAWGVEGYVVSFIAPHTLTARSLVVAPADVLHVQNQDPRNPVDVACDGEKVAELAPGAVIEVSFADDVGRLAQLPGASFYHRIREKFGRLAS